MVYHPRTHGWTARSMAISVSCPDRTHTSERRRASTKDYLHTVTSDLLVARRIKVRQALSPQARRAFVRYDAPQSPIQC